MNQRLLLVKEVYIFIIILSIIFLINYANASNFNIDLHSGFGKIRFDEKENYLGDKFDSKYRNNVFLFGGSGEYSFYKFQNFYTGISADWLFGLKDVETWKQDNLKVQTNDLDIFGQFYDLKLGYKNSIDNLDYKLYIVEGWDGLRFKRNKFIWLGTPLQKSSTEDIRLWRTGAGAELAYKIGEWSIDGRLDYSYYFDGKTKDSSLPLITFDTDGTYLNIDLGVDRHIVKELSLYAGGRYTLQRLKGKTASTNISWETKLQIFAAIINLMYVF